MNEKKETRNSNFELLRILSMLMIVMWHLLQQGGILEHVVSPLSLVVFTVLQAILVVHVNSFILVTGYFQSQSKFKWKKVWDLIFLIWFYKGIILVISLVFKLDTITPLTILKNSLPINFRDYWFLEIYLILYLISPYLNKMIENMKAKDFKCLLGILFIYMSLLSTFTLQEAYNNQYGYSLGQFIFLYLIGASIRKGIFSIPKKREKRKIKWCFGILILCIVFNASLFLLGEFLLKSPNEILSFLGNIFTTMLTKYDNPLVIIQTVCYFLLFKELHFQSKFVNALAKTTIGVYLIHTNKLLRPIVYRIFGYHAFLSSLKIALPYLLISSTVLFLICAMIEKIRIEAISIIKRRYYEKKV